jgi:hypothetical protein
MFLSITHLGRGINVPIFSLKREKKIVKREKKQIFNKNDKKKLLCVINAGTAPKFDSSKSSSIRELAISE